VCGICGVYDFRGQGATADESSLLAMCGAIAHRGPDAGGLVRRQGGKVGLGFRRLSIVDLSAAGNQPMANEDDTVWIVFNGEVYNHMELRRALEARGHRYRSRTDTETILHLYEEHGLGCLEHLRGMWGLAIWDEPKQRLVLARDRIGIKPLYYTVAGGRFAFASEIKALLRHPDVKPRLNPQGVLEYLTFMIPPAPTTMFEGIFKLPPASFLIVDEEGLHGPVTWWDPLDDPHAAVPAEELPRATLEMLDESVRLRMMSDVPVGAFLSGGIDSSAIVALMARHASGRVKTFTVAYGDSPESDETSHARMVSRLFDTEHHEVTITGDDMLATMPDLVATQDEPIGDPTCVPQFYVSKLAKEAGVSVVHVGEGSDELFCGYPWYLEYLDEERIAERLAPVLPRSSAAVAATVLRAGTRATGRGRKWLGRLERYAGGEQPFWGGATLFRGPARERILGPAATVLDRGASARFVNDASAEYWARMPHADSLGAMTYLELRNRLPELLLMRVDKVTMAVALEARVPFLDHKLVELILPQSQAVKIGAGSPKRLLKEALTGVLPDQILQRPKQGFPAPVAQWFRTITPAAVRTRIMDMELVRDGFLDRGEIEALLHECDRGWTSGSVRLWLLFNLAYWYEHWFGHSR
jgi:asparagine synthase (glutamine-hydrolysing)